MEHRKDLQNLNNRRAFLKDENRTKDVEKRKGKGFLTARENIENLCDSDSFVEYGSFIIAAQRTRRSLEDLIENTPTDGLIGGIGEVNGNYFDTGAAKCLVMSYDYMVLAGTQGLMNHRKTDRLLQIAQNSLLPIIFFWKAAVEDPEMLIFIL